MSELQLSTKLVSDIQAVLLQHDAGASDPGVTSQYLCAVVGFLLAQQDMPAPKKREVLDELAEFTLHVLEDVEKQRKSAPTTPPPPPQIEAFGIWKPKKS